MKNLKLLIILSPIIVNAGNDVNITQSLPPTSAQIWFNKKIAEMTQEKLDKMQNPTQQELDSFLFSNIGHLDQDSLKKLLIKGANPNAGFEGRTVLSRAITISKNPNIVKILIDAGANPNTPDNAFRKYSPLHQAVKINSPEMLATLINANANLEAQDSSLNTALHMAISQNNPELVQILLDADANVNQQDHAGNTPLHKAVMVNNPYIVNMLLNANADKTILNEPDIFDLIRERYDGYTPLEIANLQKNPNPEIIQMLQDPSWFSWLY